MDPMTSRPQDGCCPEYAELSRRSMLRGALALGGATFVVGSATVSASASSLRNATSVLVVLSLRGGADGMSLVVPHGDHGYYKARPTIGIPKDRLLAKDALFGLHPQLAPLLPMWNAGNLAAIHATGLSVANRSHFSAMEEVEEAHPGSSQRVGWLNRLVGTDNHHSPLQGVGVVSGPPPTELVGPVPLMTVGSLSDLNIAADDQYDTDPKGKRRRSLTTLYENDHSPIGRAMRSTLRATSHVAPVLATKDNTASYGGSGVGAALSVAARIIRGNIGVEVITVDQGEWDMHVDLGTADRGLMIGNAHDLATSLAAFFADLGSQADKVTLVTISEFGRRTAENANQGLDHGWGNVMFVAGAGVKGGKYYISQKQGWKPLSHHLEADLHVTTDYRNVLAEIVSSRFGSPTHQVFPGLKKHTLGFMA
jgi:uncharacterized protein (DUF1501 family)